MSLYTPSSMTHHIRHFLRTQSSELLMIGCAVGILLILFVPISPFFLDFLLITNFSWALTILLLAFYTDKPLGFSTFPAILLIATLFRLALNISATRLILSEAHAGKVIAAIGQFVIHDNYVMGVVVFLILIIVQYVVITHGAQRVAEVAARFTLDSMPGKQMSIDADLNMGIITGEVARTRRALIEREANFYGAMDGASKFVKGDAIAGILIMLVNLIGGFAIGMTQKGFTLSESLHTYALLTIGDGLVTQIPALTIALATGILVTRAATDAALGEAITEHVGTHPRSLIIVSIFLFGLLFLKGLPWLPTTLLFMIFATMSVLAIRKQRRVHTRPDTSSDLYAALRIYPITLTTGTALAAYWAQHNTVLMTRIQDLRTECAQRTGFVFQDITLRTLAEGDPWHYTIALQGRVYAENTLAPCRLITDLEPLMTTLRHTLLHHIEKLLTRDEAVRLLDQPHLATLRDACIPILLPIEHVQRILHNLLQEKVSIRNLHIILETILEHAKNIPDPAQLTEIIRAQLAFTICEPLVDTDKKIHVLTLAPELENKIHQGITPQGLSLDPAFTEYFLEQMTQHISNMIQAHKKPVVLCSSLVRRHLRQFTQRLMPHIHILGMQEIPLNIELVSFHVLTQGHS